MRTRAPKGVREFAAVGGLDPERMRLLWQLTTANGKATRGALHTECIAVRSGFLMGDFPAGAPPAGIELRIGWKYVTTHATRRHRGSRLVLAWVDHGSPDANQFMVLDKVLQ